MSLEIGLQMFSVRGAMAIDPIRTTRRVIEIGYRNLEYANLTDGEIGVGFPADPGELAEVIESAGASTVGVHIWPINESTIADIIAYHRDLGTKYIVSKFMYRDYDHIREMAATMNNIGERVRSAGMRHLVHTSVMRSDESRTDLDELLDHVDPEYVDVELDTYWAYRSGLDPVKMIQRYGDRIRVIHQKDLPPVISQPVDIAAAMPADAALTMGDLYYDPRWIGEDNFTEVGAGVLPIQAIIDATIRYTSAEYFLIEQDFSRLGELESVEVSLANLRNYVGLEVDR